MGESYGYSGVFTSGPLDLTLAQKLYFKIRQLIEANAKKMSGWYKFSVTLTPLTEETSCVLIGSPDYMEKQNPRTATKILQEIMNDSGHIWIGTMEYSGTGCAGDGILTMENGKVVNYHESDESFSLRMKELESQDKLVEC